jgi:hypothetical protein
MKTWWFGGALAWTLATCCPVVGFAGRPTVASPPAARTAAVMPALYFSADAASAARLTDGLREEMRARGWTVVSPAESAAAASAIGLPPRTSQPDWMALEFGHRLNADLVLYPRLLAIGAGISGPSPVQPDPAAVVLLRILDVRGGRSVYSRQVAYPLKRVARPAEGAASEFVLTADTGRATAKTALAGFQEPSGQPR